MSRTRLVIVCLLLNAAAQAQQYVISTYAGGAPQPPSSVVSLATDAAGNVYFADRGPSNSVFKLDPSGALTRVAGTSRTGYSGDGGPATSSSLYEPRGIATDRAGNLFVVDSGNQRVRKISPDGIITTVAGGGSAVLGDGGPATSGQLNYPASVVVDGGGNLFIGELGRVRKITPEGIITTVAGGGASSPGDGGPAINAQLTYARGIAVDGAGDLFIADERFDDGGDTGQYIVRKVSPSGIITTVPRVPSCCYGAIAADGVGNLFVNDDARIWRISPSGDQTLVAGIGTYGISGDGGPATQAQLNGPTAVAVDGAGNVLISNGQLIQKLSADGKITDLIRSSAPFALDGTGNLFISAIDCSEEFCDFFLRKVSATGAISTVAGVAGSNGPSGDGGPAIRAGLGFTSGLAVDGAGNVFIADLFHQRIRKIDLSGIITTIAGGTYGYSGDGGLATNAAMSYPIALAADSAGDVYFADGLNQAIRVLRPTN